jgi:hypothetical protein
VLVRGCEGVVGAPDQECPRRGLLEVGPHSDEMSTAER